MSVIGRITLHLKLLVLAALLTVLPPGPAAPQARPLTGFAAALTAIGGDLRIVIQKSRSVLTLYKGMTPVKSYWAVFGKNHTKGDKRRKGDKRTPEGEFYICSMNHSERFYKFMGLSYPSPRHAASALAGDLITVRQYYEIVNAVRERRQPPWDTRLGGAVGIHGRLLDRAVKWTPSLEHWTDGCIALNNQDVDELFSVVSLGTPVTIIP